MNQLQKAHTGDPAILADFDRLVNATLSTLGSAASKRVYLQTFRSWQDWAGRAGVDPFDLTYSTVSAFLADKPVSKASRQRTLSSLHERYTCQVWIFHSGMLGYGSKPIT